MDTVMKRTLAFIAILVVCRILTIKITGSFEFNKGVFKTASSTSAGSDELKMRHGHDKLGTFHRTDRMLVKMKRSPLLKNYRNPCWQEFSDDNNKTNVRCIPYFYLVGAPKCGTTDLYRRLRKHPQISNKVQKEQHWLARKRFTKGHKRNTSRYLEYFDDAVRRDIVKNEENKYHPMIFGDCSASLLWDNRKLLVNNIDKYMKFPPFTNADVIRRLNPDAKIIIMLRNPVSRLYSEYLYFREDGQSVEEFHNRVVSALYNMNDCFRKYSVRYCIYFMGTGPRLQIGFYHIYIEDFFRAFPREQVKILKLENYSQQINDTMIDVYRFLGLDKPPDEAMTRIENKRQANERDTEDKHTGDMLPKTRHMLAEFYKPWNEKLVQLIGEEFRY